MAAEINTDTATSALRALLNAGAGMHSPHLTDAAFTEYADRYDNDWRIRVLAGYIRRVREDSAWEPPSQWPTS